MRRVYFSREERADPLVLALGCIHEALFDREARELGVEVLEAPGSGEDNQLEWYADFDGVPGEDARGRLKLFLEALTSFPFPCLNVVVPAAELAEWEASPLDDQFSFTDESGP